MDKSEKIEQVEDFFAKFHDLHADYGQFWLNETFRLGLVGFCIFSSCSLGILVFLSKKGKYPSFTLCRCICDVNFIMS